MLAPALQCGGHGAGGGGAAEADDVDHIPGGRLDLIETLRAAAPWQPLRRAEALRCGGPVGAQVLVRAQDFRLRRYQQRQQTTTVFTVDASGSLALHRLAEAKGAVELLLADCYVRRDQVALIAFRCTGAQLLLPPTRSLVRAKRCLAELPGGVADGVDAQGLLWLRVGEGRDARRLPLHSGEVSLRLAGSTA